MTNERLIRALDRVEQARVLQRGCYGLSLAEEDRMVLADEIERLNAALADAHKRNTFLVAYVKQVILEAADCIRSLHSGPSPLAALMQRLEL